jgi:2-keto-4-pentenoate hydratase
MDEMMQALAGRLADAWVTGTTIPLPEAPVASRADAYAIQDRMAELIGGTVAGWKVGAAVEAVQFFEDHDGPLPGRVFADRAFEQHGRLSADVVHGAKGEAEFAFRLIGDLPDGDGPVSREDIADKITFHPSIELPATRYAPGTGNRASRTFDGIADNGTGGAVVLGAAVADWQGLDFETMTIDARIDGSPPIQTYSNVYRRDPVDIMADTITDIRARGIRFEKGMFLLTGSLTLPTPVRKGQTMTVTFADFPPVSMSLT